MGKKLIIKISLLLCNGIFVYSSINHVSSYPFISGDTFRAFADHILDSHLNFNPEKITPASVIFVQTDKLSQFFSTYHPRIKNPYILITHRCESNLDDDPMPGPYRKYLESEKLIAWFTQNVDSLDSAKLRHLPIGISNHQWAQGDVATFRRAIKRNPQATHSKLLYMNINIHTYPQERSLVFNLFKNVPWCSVQQNVPLFEYLCDLQNHKFALSPRGNGLDCHRTWESLMVGTIPIVRSSTLDPLYDDLPVVIIDNWQIITEEFLNKKYEEIQSKSYNLEKIYADYWFNEINACKKFFLNRAYP